MNVELFAVVEVEIVFFGRGAGLGTDHTKSSVAVANLCQDHVSNHLH